MMKYGLFFFCVGMLPWMVYSDATKEKAYSSCKKKNWNECYENSKEALSLFRKGKHLPIEKVPSFLLLGVSSFELQKQAIAWKAFEQVLLTKPFAKLPVWTSLACRSFFRKVQASVQNKLSSRAELLQITQTNSSKTTRPAWLIPSLFFGVAIATGVAGIMELLKANYVQQTTCSFAANSTSYGYVPFTQFNGEKPNEICDKVNKGEVDYLGLNSSVGNFAHSQAQDASSSQLNGIILVSVAGVLVAAGITMYILEKTYFAPPTSSKLSIHPDSSAKKTLRLVREDCCF